MCSFYMAFGNVNILKTSFLLRFHKKDCELFSKMPESIRMTNILCCIEVVKCV